MNKRISILFLLFGSVLLALTGCGGGGGSGRSVDDDVSNLPGARPKANVSGVAFDGLIIGGTVDIFDFTSGAKGEKLGSTKTDGSGLYSISLSTSDKPILIEITGGYYIEEATGKQIQVDKTKGHKLLAIEYYESGKAIEISTTFFSTVATGYAEYLMSEGMNAESAIERAYQQVDSWAGFNTRKTVPVAVNDSQNVTPFITDPHRYGFVAAAISELTRVLGKNSGNGEHNDFSSISFIIAAYKDIKVDGILDGRDAGGTISFAGYPLNSNTYRDLIALRMLQFVQAARNTTSLGFTDVLAFASTINLFSDEIFNYQSAPDITKSQPSVSQFLPAEGETISGGYQASAVVSDDYGLESVEYYVDGKFVASAGNPNDPLRNIDTFNFDNGAHTMTVVVTNVMGNSTSITHNIMVNNGNLSFSASSNYSSRVRDEADSDAHCNITLTVTDTTGLGVDLLQTGGQTVLSRATVPSGGLNVPLNITVQGHVYNGQGQITLPGNLVQDHCSYRSFTAKDYVGNSYEFGVKIIRKTEKVRRYKSSGYEFDYYSVSCSASLANSC